MESLIAKINTQTSFDEAFFNEFINAYTENLPDPKTFLDQIIQI